MAEDWLNALLLLFIHKDISLDYSVIVNIFASHNQRRMHFINPLDGWNSWFYPDIVFKEHNFCLRNSKKVLQNAGIRISDGLNFKIAPLYQFQWQAPLSQYPGSAPVTDRLNQYSKTDMLILNFSKPCLISWRFKGPENTSTRSWGWELHKGKLIPTLVIIVKIGKVLTAPRPPLFKGCIIAVQWTNHHPLDSSTPGGVLPYMGHIGMCRCEGYGFQAVYSSIGYRNQSVWV